MINTFFISKDWPLLRILKDVKDCKDVNYTKGNNKSVHKLLQSLFLTNKTDKRNKELVSFRPSSERGTNKKQPINKEQTNEAI